MKQLLIIFILITAAVFTGRFASAEAPPQRNVILIVLDGVRWQEVFRGSNSYLSQDKTAEPIFTKLTAGIQGQELLLGNRDEGDRLTLLSRTRLSMPSYTNMMAGYKRRCWHNFCGRTTVETFPERIRRELNLPVEQVATITSWIQIGVAVEHIKGATFVNAGNSPLMDSSPDDELMKLNEEQKEGASFWNRYRLDKDTFAQSLRYLIKHQPRFLFISFNDADKWAHRWNYSKYLTSLRLYDQWIAEIRATLDSLGDYGANTLLMVTTDHGRGSETNWGEHGTLYPDSKYFWLYAHNPLLPQNSGRMVSSHTPYTQANIRPTIEAFMGLEPFKCLTCGDPIREILE